MKTVKSKNQLIIENDILRYKKNKLASTLALLGLVFNCLYFMLLYSMSKPEFKTITIGFSVILTLVILLVIFLSSEGVKGYNKKFSFVLVVVAAFQIFRIFGYPMKGMADNLFVAANSAHRVSYFGMFPKTSSLIFTILLVYLVASAACLVASAVIGYIYAVRLERFQKKLDSGEVDVMAVIKEMDKEDEEKAAAAEAVSEVVEEAKSTEEVQ